MPTYEYACPDCKYSFEEFQSITAKPVKVCPKCKGRKVKRLISAGAGLIFKGSGFYLTDYRKGNTTKDNSSKPKADSGSESSASKSSADEGSGSGKADKPAAAPKAAKSGK